MYLIFIAQHRSEAKLYTYYLNQELVMVYKLHIDNLCFCINCIIEAQRGYNTSTAMLVALFSLYAANLPSLNTLILALRLNQTQFEY